MLLTNIKLIVIDINHDWAIIDGKTSGTSTVEIDNVHYVLFNGYPASRGIGDNDGTSAAAAYGLKDLLELDTTATGDFKITESSTTTIIQHTLLR